MQGLNRHFAIATVYATLIPGTAWTAMPGGIRSGLQSASQTGGGSNRPNVTVIVDGDVRHKTLEWFGQAEPSVLAYHIPKRLTENELSDFSRLWHDGCVKAIIEAQDVDRNHSAQV